MVNFHDPDVVKSDIRAVFKFWHAVGGLYLWEFLTTLDYEWNVFRGRRPYQRSIWIYSFTRVATLVTVILNMGGVDILTAFNCQVWDSFEVIFAYTAFVAASLLIVLRIIAIWNKNKVTAIAVGVWVTDIAFLIRGAVPLRYSWEPTQETCTALNPQSTKLNTVAPLITDVSLLIIMLVGLVRLRSHRGSAFGLGRLLWKQGVVWLLLAPAAEVTPVVFISLNLNGAFDLMFQIPSLIVMTIASTRMHRSLVDYVSRPTSAVQVIPRNYCRAASATNQMPAPRIPGNQMEVAVHTTHMQYPPSQTSLYDSNIGMHWQLGDERTSQDLHDDVESNA